MPTKKSKTSGLMKTKAKVTEMKTNYFKENEAIDKQSSYNVK